MKKLLFSNKDYNSNIRQGLQLSFYFSITVKVFVFFSCHVDCPVVKSLSTLRWRIKSTVFNACYRLRTILKQNKRTLSCLILNIMEKKPRVWTFLWKSYIVEHAHNSILFLYLPSPLLPSDLNLLLEKSQLPVLTRPSSLSGRNIGLIIWSLSNHMGLFDTSQETKNSTALENVNKVK